MIDGCGWARIFGQIYLPNAKPSLLVVIMFTFVNTWNDYFGPMIYLTNPRKYTVALGLTPVSYTHLIPLTSAALELSSLQSNSTLEKWTFTPHLKSRLHALYAQSFRTTLAPYVLPRLLARS